jgi:hypothetical protein
LTEPFQNERDKAGFRGVVSENLDEGRFRLIIAVDQATEELIRTVVFLNSHTPPDVHVLALELRPAGGGEPRVHGRSRSEVGPPPIRVPRARRRLLEEIRARTGEPAGEVAERVLAWAALKPRQLEIRDAGASSATDTRLGTLVRIARYEELQVVPGTLVAHGEPWDAERIESLEKKLARMGFTMERGKGKSAAEVAR